MSLSSITYCALLKLKAKIKKKQYFSLAIILNKSYRFFSNKEVFFCFKSCLEWPEQDSRFVNIAILLVGHVLMQILQNLNWFLSKSSNSSRLRIKCAFPSRNRTSAGFNLELKLELISKPYAPAFLKTKISPSWTSFNFLSHAKVSVSQIFPTTV